MLFAAAHLFGPISGRASPCIYYIRRFFRYIIQGGIFNVITNTNVRRVGVFMCREAASRTSRRSLKTTRSAAAAEPTLCHLCKHHMYTRVYIFRGAQYEARQMRARVCILDIYVVCHRIVDCLCDYISAVNIAQSVQPCDARANSIQLKIARRHTVCGRATHCTRGAPFLDLGAAPIKPS